MKIGIVGLLSNPNPKTSKLTSIQQQLIGKLYGETTLLTEKDDWDQYPYLYLVQQQTLSAIQFEKDLHNITTRAEKLVDYVAFGKGQLLSSNHDIDVNDILSSLPTPLPSVGIVTELALDCQTNNNKLIMGDYHATAIWPSPDYGISIAPNKTLASFLDAPVPADWYYFGNEDIRHYLADEANTNPQQATYELALDYVATASIFDAKVTCLLPAEPEKRIISKAYHHNGKPFNGSQALRAELIAIFNETLMQSAHQDKVHQWPAWWYEKPYLYESTIMESKPTPYIYVK